MGVVDNNMFLPEGAILRNIYRIDGYLASGGFGKTYLAHNIMFNERVAIKEFFLRGSMMRIDDGKTVYVCNPDEASQVQDYLNSFYDEASRMHNISSPNIVKVHDIFEENNTAYYVMDYIDGKSLDKILEERGRPFTSKEVVAVMTQVLDAMEAIHGMGLWHLDIKPNNIMLDNTGRAVLIDFGTSKQIDLRSGAQITSAAMAFTPGFAPLEQRDYNASLIGPWTDLYSLGATIYNLLTNQDPPTESDINSIGRDAFNFLPDTNESLKTLTMWLMNPYIEHRPQSVSDVKGFIKNADFSSEQGVKGKVVTLDLHNMGIDSTQRKKKKRKDSFTKTLLVSGVAFLITLLVAIGVIYVVRSGVLSSKDTVQLSSEDEPVMVENDTIKVKEEKDSVICIYSGPMVNKKPHGKGVATYIKGEFETIYEGNFVHGVRDDEKATLRYTKGPYKGDVYEGGFKNNTFDGECTYYKKKTNRTFKGIASKGEFFDGAWYKNNVVVSYVDKGAETKKKK